MKEERRDGLERVSTRQECGGKRVRGTRGGGERQVQSSDQGSPEKLQEWWASLDRSSRSGREPCLHH